MARDTYSGGGTLIWLDEGGTRWDSLDTAEDYKRMKRPTRDERASTKKEIEVAEQREDREERKILRSFISRCAAAYVAKNQRRLVSSVNVSQPPVEISGG